MVLYQSFVDSITHIARIFSAEDDRLKIIQVNI